MADVTMERLRLLVEVVVSSDTQVRIPCLNPAVCGVQYHVSEAAAAECRRRVQMRSSLQQITETLPAFAPLLGQSGPSPVRAQVNQSLSSLSWHRRHRATRAIMNGSLGTDSQGRAQVETTLSKRQLLGFPRMLIPRRFVSEPMVAKHLTRRRGVEVEWVQPTSDGRWRVCAHDADGARGGCAAMLLRGGRQLSPKDREDVATVSRTVDGLNGVLERSSPRAIGSGEDWDVPEDYGEEWGSQDSGDVDDGSVAGGATVAEESERTDDDSGWEPVLDKDGHRRYFWDEEQGRSVPLMRDADGNVAGQGSREQAELSEIARHRPSNLADHTTPEGGVRTPCPHPELCGVHFHMSDGARARCAQRRRDQPLHERKPIPMNGPDTDPEPGVPLFDPYDTSSWIPPRVRPPEVQERVERAAGRLDDLESQGRFVRRGGVGMARVPVSMFGSDEIDENGVITDMGRARLGLTLDPDPHMGPLRISPRGVLTGPDREVGVVLASRTGSRSCPEMRVSDVLDPMDESVEATSFGTNSQWRRMRDAMSSGVYTCDADGGDVVEASYTTRDIFGWRGLFRRHGAEDVARELERTTGCDVENVFRNASGEWSVRLSGNGDRGAAPVVLYGPRRAQRYTDEASVKTVEGFRRMNRQFNGPGSHGVPRE